MTRRSVSILFLLILAGISLCVSTATTLGEDGDPLRDARREWFNLANGRTEFDVSDSALLPKPLRLAVEQSGCPYQDAIKHEPVRFISVERRRLALVFCSGIVGWHQVFDLENLLRPRLVEFPYRAQDYGFGTTSRPGYITLQKGTGIFEAETTSDIICSGRLRHSYRLAWTNGRSSFVIVRIDKKDDSCRQDGWTTIWDAPRW